MWFSRLQIATFPFLVPSAFTLLGSSWQFFVRQPLLKRVLLEMLYLPTALLFIVIELGSESSMAFLWLQTQSGATPLSIHALLLLVNILFSLWLLWGIACVLVIGRRIIKNPAGRSRSSMSVVRREAFQYVLPLFLTDLLRDCITALWSLLLVLPGIIYRTRTAFFAIVTVCEGKEYRDALKGSATVVKGRTWMVFWQLVSLMLLVLIPAWVCTIAIFLVVDLPGSLGLPLVSFIAAIPLSIGFLFYQLATVHLYKALKS
jgi:hypothetical protein